MGLAKTFLAIGIAVLFTVFVCYGLFVVYEPPKYGYADTSACFQQFGCSNMTVSCDNANMVNGTFVKDVPYNDACYQKVYASAEYKRCMEDNDNCVNNIERGSDNFKHSRNSFYVLIVLAVISIIAGVMLSHLEGIGSGFIGGGVLIVLWSLAYTTDYWTTLNKYLKLIAVGAVLVLLIWLGYKKLESKLK